MILWEPFDSRMPFDRDLWRHFHVARKFGTVLKRQAECQHCKQRVGWGGCTGNLRKHLQRNHPELLSKPTPDPLPDNFDQAVDELVRRLGPRKKAEKIQCMADLWVPCSTIKRLGGKYPIWRLFSLEQHSVRYARCDLCQKQVYWNREGQRKLKKHIQTHHLNTK